MKLYFIAAIVLYISMLQIQDTYTRKYENLSLLRRFVWIYCCGDKWLRENGKIKRGSYLSLDVDNPHRTANLEAKSISSNVGIGDSKQRNIRAINETEAKKFLFRKRELAWECCILECSFEEVNEGSNLKADELGEECVHEGCSREEIKEHC